MPEPIVFDAVLRVSELNPGCFTYFLDGQEIPDLKERLLERLYEDGPSQDGEFPCQD